MEGYSLNMSQVQPHLSRVHKKLLRHVALRPLRDKTGYETFTAWESIVKPARQQSVAETVSHVAITMTPTSTMTPKSQR